MPVNAGSIILHLVGDGDAESVAPISGNDRTWVLPVDQQALLIAMAILVASGVGDGQRVSLGHTSAGMLLVEIGRNTVTATPASPREGAITAGSVCYQGSA